MTKRQRTSAGERTSRSSQKGATALKGALRLGKKYPPAGRRYPLALRGAAGAYTPHRRMESPDPIERLDGTAIDARFRLTTFVARGGYGAVYRGSHNALDCPVAVKVLAVPAALREAERERFFEAFEREARIVATLRHPSIVRVLDFGVTDIAGVAHPFIVLEWLDGETLEARLRADEGRPRAPREAMALLRPVIDAIAAAHEAGVAHRDLKPANVMVSAARRGDASVKVLDFGVAKVFSPDEDAPDWTERTTDPHSPFSLSHAAPEQVAKLRTGPWTDVHALALLLVEALVGQRAYAGRTAIELYASISTPHRPTPSRFSVEVGPWEPVLARALSITPGDRHANAAALLADLDASLDDAQRAWEEGRAPRTPSAPPPAEPAVTSPASPTAPSREPAGRTTYARRGALAVAVLAALGAHAVAAVRGRASAPPAPAAAPAAPAAPPRAADPPAPTSPAAPPPERAPPAAAPPVAPVGGAAAAQPARRPPRAAPRARPRARDGGADEDFVIE